MVQVCYTGGHSPSPMGWWGSFKSYTILHDKAELIGKGTVGKTEGV